MWYRGMQLHSRRRHRRGMGEGRSYNNGMMKIGQALLYMLMLIRYVILMHGISACREREANFLLCT